MERIRIIVGDSSVISCELLKSALKHDRSFEIVALATTMDQLAQAASTVRADIVLLNPVMNGNSSDVLGRLRHLVTLVSPARVILLIDGSDNEEVIQAFRAGAKGLFRRSESLQNLLRCVHAVHEGQIWATSSDLDATLQAFASGRSSQWIASGNNMNLTQREQQVMVLVAEGLGNREISDRLHLSEHTVKNYLFRIYEKLGISTRVELTLYAISRRSAE